MATTEEALLRAAREIDDGPIDADPRVKKMRAEIAGAERDHAASTRESARLRSRLEGIDENLVRAHKALSDLRDRLPQVYASVLVGRGTAAQERDLLDRIAELEHVVSRGRVGRPLVEAMIREQAHEVTPHARRIEDLHRSMERLRNEVRTELARQAMA